jgi:hypothetical protein
VSNCTERQTVAAEEEATSRNKGESGLVPLGFVVENANLPANITSGARRGRSVELFLPGEDTTSTDAQGIGSI